MIVRRILVVDAEAPIREVVVACLKRLGGWEVLTATTGQEALQKSRSEQPDVIVVDGMMPEMNDFTFLKRLRADAATQKIPVVLLTPNRYLSGSQLFSHLGIVLTIPKPFQSVDLVQKIAQVMGW